VERIAEKRGITTDEANKEIQRRARVLEWMRERNVRNYKEVSDMIRRYYEDPEFVYKEATSNG
jgi:flagellar protein FlaI